MSSFAVLIGPIIIALAAAAVVIGLAAWACGNAVNALLLHKRQSRAFIENAKIKPTLLRQQEDAIASVIGELESRPATYETFPSDIRDALYAAHTMARETERQLSR